MKNCTDCVHAEWKRTSGGKLHPSGDGKCTKTIVLPPLPSSFRWGYGYTWNEKPVPKGGDINRREELREHCPCWARKE